MHGKGNASRMMVRYVMFVAAAIMISGCSAQRPAPGEPSGGTLPAAVRATVPAPRATGERGPLVRPGEAARQPPDPDASGIVIVSETFQNGVTAPNAWFYTSGACLTAGATPPPSSIPACGNNAPQDPPGSGALQLTAPTQYATTIVGWNAPLPTARGLDIVFTSFAFDGTGGDGTLLFFTDGSQAPPAAPGYSGGCLAYLGNIPGACPGSPLANAFLGVGFDEFGDFSAFLKDSPGRIPETVDLAGGQAATYAYLGGVDNHAGKPVSLPFNLDDPKGTKRLSTAPTMDVTLDAIGLVEVAIDIHDGRGFVRYVSKNIVGVNGQPAVPASVYVGFAG